MKKIDLKKCWIYLFLVCFLVVPLVIIENPMILAAVFLLLCAVVIYKLNIPKFPLFLFLFALVLRIGIVLVLKTPPFSDFEGLFNASQGMVNGDYSFQEMGYFKLWSYQIGFVFYQSLFLRIWNDILILKLVNCLVTSATCVLVYLIAREFADEKASRFVSLVYCILPFPLFYVTVLTNQFPSSFLIYLAIYILITDKIKLNVYIKYLIFSVLLVFADVLRPESIIPVLSVLIYLVLTMNKKNLLEKLICIAIVVVTYFGLCKLVSALFVVTGLAPLGLTNNDPLWKFVLGFSHETGGSYNAADEPFLGVREAELELIKSRIMVPVSQLKELFETKIAKFWMGSSLAWPFKYCLVTGLTVFGITFNVADDVTIMDNMTKWIMVALYGLIIVGVFKYLKNKDYNNKILLLVNQMFVTFGIYLLIEVQSRYSYHIQICAIILASLGVYAVCERISKNRALRKAAKNSD